MAGLFLGVGTHLSVGGKLRTNTLLFGGPIPKSHSQLAGWVPSSADFLAWDIKDGTLACSSVSSGNFGKCEKGGLW